MAASARKYRGVYPSGKTFRAYIGHQGKRIFIGAYPTAEEAARAFDAKAKELGAVVVLNFPQEPAAPADEDLPVLQLAVIRVDGGTQSRAKIYPDTVAEYVETLTVRKQRLPPVTVYHDGKHYWLALGFHRFFAYRAAGIERISCIVKTGTVLDAKLASAGSNAEHGRQRNAEDKRSAVRLLLSEPAWAARSDRWVAEQARVSHDLVGDVRRETGDAPTGDERQFARTGKDGKKRPQFEAPKPLGNGEILFDWPAFHTAWGALLRQVDSLGRPYKANNTPQAEGFRRRLSEWKKDLKQWYKTLAKAEAPEE